MSALLDTSVLSGLAQPPVLEQDWAVSVLSIGELSAGVLLAASASTRAARLRSLTLLVEIAPVLSIDTAVAQRFGELRAASGRRTALPLVTPALSPERPLWTSDPTGTGGPIPANCAKPSRWSS